MKKRFTPLAVCLSFYLTCPVQAAEETPDIMNKILDSAESVKTENLTSLNRVDIHRIIVLRSFLHKAQENGLAYEEALKLAQIGWEQRDLNLNFLSILFHLHRRRTPEGRFFSSL